MTTLNRLPFAHHIHELKSRLFRFMGVFLCLFCLCFYFSETLFTWLARPLEDLLKYHNLPIEVIYTHLTEAFGVYVQVAFFGTLMLSFPYLEWHIWCFTAPGLLPKEKKSLPFFLWACPLLFIMGAGLCYYYVLPHVLAFFIQFSTDATSSITIRLMAQMEGYLSLVMKFIFTFGLCFQLPLIMLLLAHLGIGSASFYTQKRRFVIVGIFIGAAFLTPPDVLSQLMLALPLWGLYELAIIVIKLQGKR